MRVQLKEILSNITLLRVFTAANLRVGFGEDKKSWSTDIAGAISLPVRFGRLHRARAAS